MVKFIQSQTVLCKNNSNGISIFYSEYYRFLLKIPAHDERKQLFDYSWKFFLGDAASAQSKDFNDENWRNLDLPHDWSIEGTGKS